MSGADILNQLGRQTVRIGSSKACEICLDQAHVAPVAAEIVHSGAGHLRFIPSKTSHCRAGGKPLSADVAVPFDFTIPFDVDGVRLPNAHPALCLMTMGRGHLPPHPELLVVGRDPERCHIVMNSPGVSGCHASFRMAGELAVADQGSKSGTWYEGKRLLSNSFHPVPEGAVLALGPLLLPVALARALHDALLGTSSPQKLDRTQAMPMPTLQRQALPSRIPTPPPVRNRTVIGTIKMSQASRSRVGRTSDNAIILDYAQVAAHHAELIQIDQQVYIEDLGSEPGTFVRGTRLRPVLARG